MTRGCAPGSRLSSQRPRLCGDCTALLPSVTAARSAPHGGPAPQLKGGGVALGPQALRVWSSYLLSPKRQRGAQMQRGGSYLVSGI